jgi:SET domain-containing protein
MYNHSDTPNCYNKKINNKRYLVTLHAIPRGEELTADYRLQPDLEQPTWQV